MENSIANIRILDVVITKLKQKVVVRIQPNIQNIQNPSLLDIFYEISVNAPLCQMRL
jgi:hypothetical protein